MNKIEAKNGGQISFGDKSPNITGDNNKVLNKFNKTSFLYGIITGVIASLIGSYIWKVIEVYFAQH